MSVPSAEWARVKELFHAALSESPERRVEYLQRVCGEDCELRGELESLLAAHDTDDELLDQPLLTPAGVSCDSEDSGDWSGRRIGVYRIAGEIGRGGMGHVYEARRDDAQYEQRVAIKILRPGFGTRFFVERLRRERQVLAGFDHPNIARLFDGGSTPDGTPYLVMEYIEGLDIFEYCVHHGLDTHRRLELFRQLCGAVHYVHQRLTVHGDVKCRNILVTTDGRVKLLDFGLAKLIDAAQTTGPNATVVGLVALTPRYASPEQLRGQPLTTAADTYSLGVVLHRLLTGELPICTCDVPCRADPHLCAAQWVRPSEIVRKGVPSRNRHDPASLARQLRGDLDSIITTALAGDPARRYSSVEQFSDDVRRYLSNLPILARQDAFGYQLRKFVRRHSLAVAASALFVLSLAGTTAVMSWQAHVIAIERARAERRFNDVRQLANSLIFDIHDSIADLAGAAASRHVLIDTALKYLDSLSHDAVGDPTLQIELAAAYQRLGDLQGRALEANEGNLNEAMKSYRRALALRQSVIVKDPNNVAARRDMVGNCGKLSDLLWNLGNAAEALSFSRETISNSQLLAALDPTNRRYSVLVASSTMDYAFKLFKIRGSSRESLDLMVHSIASLQSLSAAEPANQRLGRTLALAYGRAGEMLSHDGRHTEALRLYQQARRLLGALSGEAAQNADFAHLMGFADHQLAEVLTRMGHLEEAMPYESSALGAFRRLAETEPRIGEYHIDVGLALAGMADIVERKGEPERAIALLEEALEQAAAAGGAASTDVHFLEVRADAASLMGKAYASLATDGRRSQSQHGRDCGRAHEFYGQALTLYKMLSATSAQAAEDARRVVDESAKCDRTPGDTRFIESTGDKSRNPGV